MTANRIVRWVMAGFMGSVAIASIAVKAQAQGYTSILASGETEAMAGYFLANENIYASCDQNCEDLDIYLYDALSGELVASDTLLDANPVVTAPYEGDFVIEVVMVTCYTDVCEAWTGSDHGF